MEADIEDFILCAVATLIFRVLQIYVVMSCES
jgi:hypothetical protein